MFAKITIVLILIGIIASLGSALIFLVKDHGQGNRSVKALSVRIGMSVTLFGLLYLLSWLGYITPHGITPAA
ncbi:MAG: twin transmembrane helix small protein [Granulosicoccaceae bacterium]|jgi:hypothetical protein